MKTLIILLSSFFLFISVMPVSAVTVEELLKDPNISSTQREAIAKAINNIESQPTGITKVLTDPESINKFQALGDAVVTTIQRVCHGLNIEVNEFIKTDVGKLTAFFIGYNIMGRDIIRISVYSMALTFISFVWLVFMFISLTKSKKHFKVIKKHCGEEDVEEVKIPLNKINWSIDSYGNELVGAKEIACAIMTVIWGVFTSVLLYNII